MKKPVVAWSLNENLIYCDDDGINDGRMVIVEFTDNFGKATKARKLEVLEAMVKVLKTEDQHSTK